MSLKAIVEPLWAFKCRVFYFVRIIIETIFNNSKCLVCFPGVWCSYRYEYEATFPGAEQNPWSFEDARPQTGTRVCFFKLLYLCQGSHLWTDSKMTSFISHIHRYINRQFSWLFGNLSGQVIQITSSVKPKYAWGISVLLLDLLFSSILSVC